MGGRPRARCCTALFAVEHRVLMFGGDTYGKQACCVLGMRGLLCLLCMLCLLVAVEHRVRMCGGNIHGKHA